MGGPGARRVPVMECPYQCTLFKTFSLAGKGCMVKGNSLSMHPSEARSLSAHHSIRINRRCSFYTSFAVFCRFSMALPIHPLGLKEGSRIDFLNSAPLYRFFLVMHHSGLFFLKALFLRAVRPGPAAFFRRVRKQ